MSFNPGHRGHRPCQPYTKAHHSAGGREWHRKGWHDWHLAPQPLTQQPPCLCPSAVSSSLHFCLFLWLPMGSWVTFVIINSWFPKCSLWSTCSLRMCLRKSTAGNAGYPPSPSWDSWFTLSVQSSEKSHNHWFHSASIVFSETLLVTNTYLRVPKEYLWTGFGESLFGKNCHEQCLICRNPVKSNSLMRNLASKADGKMNALCSKENMTFV